MAFTGTPTIQQISDRCCRITGVSLAAGDSGVIGLSTSGAEVELPASFKPTPYHYQPTANSVSLIESVRIYLNPVTDVSNFQIPIRVVKTGSTHALFAATFTNDEAAVASPNLEIYVEFRD